MKFFDMPLARLETYQPQPREPDDFDQFWQDTLSASRQHSLDAQFEPVDFGLRTVETFDVTFSGYGGQRVKGWLLRPRHRDESLPCVIEYIGYGGGRGFPIDWLVWSSAGYAHFIMDTRGQGSRWLNGDTPDIPVDGANPHFPGFMTQGILDPKTYYYRRVFTDGVRAVEAARSHPAIDSERVAITGRSQGGGITIAVSGLDDTVRVAMPDVPFLCHYKRATEIIETHPYVEISHYCQSHRDKVDIVFETLSYFDGINFASRAKAQALFSVGLMDEICPPSTVYAAYNHYAGQKDIRAWEYNQHEGGDSHHQLEQIRLLHSLWPPD